MKSNWCFEISFVNQNKCVQNKNSFKQNCKKNKKENNRLLGASQSKIIRSFHFIYHLSLQNHQCNSLFFGINSGPFLLSCISTLISRRWKHGVGFDKSFGDWLYLNYKMNHKLRIRRIKNSQKFISYWCAWKFILAK